MEIKLADIHGYSARKVYDDDFLYASVGATNSNLDCPSENIGILCSYGMDIEIIGPDSFARAILNCKESPKKLRNLFFEVVFQHLSRHPKDFIEFLKKWDKGAFERGYTECQENIARALGMESNNSGIDVPYTEPSLFKAIANTKRKVDDLEEKVWGKPNIFEPAEMAGEKGYL